MTGLLQDLRYAIRRLVKNPGFTAVAVITLALGIGANTAVFSVMSAVLLRTLPVHDPQQLYYLQAPHGMPDSATNTGDFTTSFSQPVFEALRQRHDVLQELIAYVPLNIGKTTVRYGETPEEARGDEVSGNFFSGLAAGMSRGRSFTLDDEKAHSAIVVLSYSYWTRRFAANPSVLGETFYVKGVPFTVIGIAAPGFYGVEPGNTTDFWIPLQNRPELNAWGTPPNVTSLYGTPKWWCLLLIARLRPDVTPERAQAALQSTFMEGAKIGVGTIDPKRWKPLLNFASAKGMGVYSETLRGPVQILMGLVVLVLLIACTNVALLLMARNEARQREFSVKLTVGAGKAHLFRQLFSESLLLVGAGSGLGWLFALSATRALADWSGIETGLDPDCNVLLFTLAVSATVALAFGLAPLRIALRAPIAGTLRASAANITQNRSGAAGRRLLLSCQVAICLLLLVAAGLLLRTLRNYETENLGIHTDDLLVFGVTPHNTHTRQESILFYRALLDRIRALPGVSGATFMENRIGSGWSNNGDDPVDGVSKSTIRSNDIGPNYFSVLGIPILQGREISDLDTHTSQPVAVVNETFVKHFLPNTNPVGHRVRNAIIIGVARDSKYGDVAETPVPMAYYAAFQNLNAGETMHFEIRTSGGEPLGLLPTLRGAARESDPDIPLEKPTTQRTQFAEDYARPKMFAWLGAFFGALAALLVATGLYGTLSYRTHRRTAEIGLRMALGAQRGQVLWMVMRESLLISLIGIAVGVPLTLLCARFLRSMLYELSPFDAFTFVLATCCVALVGVGAALIPARRAAKVDPMVALRYE